MMKYTEKYKELRDRVSEIIEEHDPVGLRASGAPDGEYALEVGSLLPRLHQAGSAEDVRRIIQEEFVRWFGKTATSENAYKGVASEIWELINDEGPADSV